MCYFNVKLAQNWEMCFALFCLFCFCFFWSSLDIYFILNDTFQFWTDQLSYFIVSAPAPAAPAPAPAPACASLLFFIHTKSLYKNSDNIQMLRVLPAMVLVVKHTHKSKTPPFPQKVAF